MEEFFGDLERFFAQLYPYRWALTIGALIVVTAIFIYGYRKGWHLLVWRHRLPVAIIGAPVLAIFLVAGWWLGSPLFTSKTVIEEFPFAFNAEVPAGITRDAVEQTMASMSRFNQRFSEAMPNSMGPGGAAAAKIKSGSFRDADNFHKGSGQATIYRSQDGSHLLRLENLNVTNGPDLHVILTPDPSPDSRGDVKAAGYVDLGKLKGNKGDQNYHIPSGVDINAQGSVVIYCQPFHVIFSVATLQQEEFPLAANAEVPPTMTRARVEQIMVGMAGMDLEFSEPMSDAMSTNRPNDAMTDAGMAMMKGGKAMVQGGMLASNHSIVSEGMALVREGAGMANQANMASVAMETMESGIQQSDNAMTEKGMAMLEGVMEMPAGASAGGTTAVKLKVGNLRDADRFHKGSGQATIYRGPDGSHLLRLEGLNVTNGPDLHVLLSPHQGPKNRNDVTTAGYVDLGKLKGNKGDQNYPIPPDVDISIQGSLIIYCAPFHVVFSVAPLEDVG